MRTAAYLRSSTKLQENSIRMQMFKAKECATKNTLSIDTFYEDEFVSARKTTIEERKRLNELFQDIQKGRVDTLIVYKRDRLARDIEQYLEIYEFLIKHNITVYFAADNEIPLQKTAVGEFFEVIMAGFNEREGNTIAERIKETKKSLAKSGKIALGRPSLGYKADPENPGVWKKVPSDVHAIKELFEEFLENDFSSISEFLRIINDKGIEKPNGKPWDQSVKKTLSNKIYHGVVAYEFEDESFCVQMEDLKIIDDEIWEKVQQKLKQFERAPYSKKNIPQNLKGRIICQECLLDMDINERFKKGNKYYTYRCNTHPEIEISFDVTHKVLEDLVVRRLQTYHNDHVGKRFSNLMNKKLAALDEEIASTQSDISVSEEVIAKETEKYIVTNASSPYPITTITNLVKENDSRKAFIDELETQKQALLHSWENFDALKENVAKRISTLDKFELLKKLVKTCEVTRSGHLHDIKIYNPAIE